MPLELKTADDTWWITDAEVVSGGDTETSYCVRRLTLETHREITKRHTKPETYRKPAKRDEDAIQDELFDYVLVDWKGVVVKGQPVPCQWDVKKLLDVPRRIALLDEAGLNDIAAAEDARVESFRPAPPVR